MQLNDFDFPFTLSAVPLIESALPLLDSARSFTRFDRPLLSPWMLLSSSEPSLIEFNQLLRLSLLPFCRSNPLLQQSEMLFLGAGLPVRKSGLPLPCAELHVRPSVLPLLVAG